jgi:hypothetical protein
MTYWSPLVVEGLKYDLSHLEPFQFQVTPREISDPATISVRFHDHCFTTTYDTKKHLEITRSSQHSAREERTFDLNRYELSKLLPDFIKALDGKRIASSRHGNLIRAELASGGI